MYTTLDSSKCWVFKEERGMVVAMFLHLEDAFILAINGYSSGVSIWKGDRKVWDFRDDGYPKVSQLEASIKTCQERSSVSL